MTSRVTKTVLKRALSRTSLAATSSRSKVLFSGTGAFDSANGKLVSIQGDTISCEITPDPYTKGTDEKSHSQWFNFSVSNVAERRLTYEVRHPFISLSLFLLPFCLLLTSLPKLLNAGQTSYPGGWKNYHPFYSEDGGKTWLRVSTSSYDEQTGVLRWVHTARASKCFFAYFEPYSYERHLALVARAGSSPFCSHRSLGQTLDGRDIDLLSFVSLEPAPASLPRKARIWIIARQHPGESMAEHFMEGLIHRLIDASDPVARKLRASADIFVVPNINPDGSFRGYLRTNASGANLNREWWDAPAEKDYLGTCFYFTFRLTNTVCCVLFNFFLRLFVYTSVSDNSCSYLTPPLLSAFQL